MKVLRRRTPGNPGGFPSCRSCSTTSARALTKPLGAIPVRFVSIPTLIRMKEAAGRPQDRIDIDHLRMRLDDDGEA
jgi:hypothetical protein